MYKVVYIKETDGDVITKIQTFAEGRELPETSFQTAIKYIKHAGDRLHDINKWSGKETIKI